MLGVGAAQNRATNEKAALALTKVAGNFKDKALDNYRFTVETSPVMSVAIMLFKALQIGDKTQYTEDELREMKEAQSRIRVHLSEPEIGYIYPTVRAYHVNDTRIPVRYVGKNEQGQYSVALEENGSTIYWSPDESGEQVPHTPPSQDDGESFSDIWVNPLSDAANDPSTALPIPEESDWRDAILVFPVGSGIEPLYVVFQLRGPNGRFISSGEPKPSLQRPSLRAETKRQIEANAEKDANGNFIDGDDEIILEWHYGHKTGVENRRILKAADEIGMSQEELNDFMNSRPDYYQIEDAKKNLSHKDEKSGTGELNKIKRDMKKFLNKKVTHNEL
ncbi:S-type pyocin domain-containing protein [Photobacterium nomapromontoriensis]|uniref:S-type pyocin domain-containing protein n=1 Tax=Photobacterium nomapromontoriensis TaxID=2910237 RepID=UPI003D0CED3B